MELETMRPDPAWEAGAHADAVDVLAGLGDEFTVLVWGDDGCGDCRDQLPAFGAALAAAGIGRDRVTHYPVERLPEGRKRGPRVEEYGIRRIPTVVVERDGEEVVRFVEEADQPIADYLAERLRELEASV